MNCDNTELKRSSKIFFFLFPNGIAGRKWVNLRGKQFVSRACCERLGRQRVDVDDMVVAYPLVRRRSLDRIARLIAVARVCFIWSVYLYR